MAAAQRLVLRVNGAVSTVQVDPATPLIYVLRNNMGLTGSKLGCALDQCGACRVLVDGAPAYSCTLAVAKAAASSVVTVEGLADGAALSALQQAFITHRAAQCGYCTAGMLISATALLRDTPNPSAAEVRAALQPHLCRCGAHPRIERAVLAAAQARS
ncbi:MAG: 2Fe-2S iron-sulfur cluster binding domain-containing protein [Gammaproteobacteria bacterium]|nr:2Fe-2S iron-sulfur cluster binding domain-containing protein [Gammaproteobacteria bacterium]